MKIQGTPNDSHAILYREAIANISKAAKDGEQWETEIAATLTYDVEKQATNTLLIPFLKRHAAALHEAHDKLKKKVNDEIEQTRQVRYRDKKMGQWHMDRDMGGKGLPTLNAARRKKTGPAGQKEGTVATCPVEVDEIARVAL